MREKRIYVECDRCKTSITLTKKQEAHGVEIYEDLPEGWLRVNNQDFCPDCAKAYQKVMKDFYK